MYMEVSLPAFWSLILILDCHLQLPDTVFDILWQINKCTYMWNLKLELHKFPSGYMKIVYDITIFLSGLAFEGSISSIYPLFLSVIIFQSKASLYIPCTYIEALLNNSTNGQNTRTDNIFPRTADQCKQPTIILRIRKHCMKWTCTIYYPNIWITIEKTVPSKKTTWMRMSLCRSS